ncbi:MAG TPA: hypothetical protein V6D33_12530 [Cyanophyceae cyanobacterium]
MDNKECVESIEAIVQTLMTVELPALLEQGLKPHQLVQFGMGVNAIAHCLEEEMTVFSSGSEEELDEASEYIQELEKTIENLVEQNEELSNAIYLANGAVDHNGPVKPSRGRKIGRGLGSDRANGHRRSADKPVSRRAALGARADDWAEEDSQEDDELTGARLGEFEPTETTVMAQENGESRRSGRRPRASRQRLESRLGFGATRTARR